MNKVSQILAGLNGVSFVGLDIETVVPLKGGRANEMKGRVTKRVTGTVLVAQNRGTNTYQNMVRKAIVGEMMAAFTEKLNRAAEARELVSDILPAEAYAEFAAKLEEQLAETDEDRADAAAERFTAQARKWGERIPNTPIIQHIPKGETTPRYYLDTIWLRAGAPEFFLDGQHIDEADIVGYEKPVAREGDNIQGGLKAEHQITVRSLSLDSIRGMRAGGEVYTGAFTY